MEQYEDRIPAIEEVALAYPTEASLRLQVTDLLLSRLRDLRRGQSNREQSEVLQRIEAALFGVAQALLTIANFLESRKAEVRSTRVFRGWCTKREGRERPERKGDPERSPAPFEPQPAAMNI